jgi:hypothetical protein
MAEIGPFIEILRDLASGLTQLPFDVYARVPVSFLQLIRICRNSMAPAPPGK